MISKIIEIIKDKKLLTIILIAFFLRMLFLFYADLNKDFYWEYGEIAKNVINNKGYSLFYLTNEKLDFHYTTDSTPEPSAYMPPGYVYYLIPFLLIDDIFLRNILLIVSQIIISLITLMFLFGYVKEKFNANVAYLSILIYAIYPEFVYSVISYSPTILFHFLLIIFFLLIEKYFIHLEWRYILYLSIIAAIIIYLRSEFLLFTAFVMIFLFIKKQYAHSFIFILLLLVIITPWAIRNYVVFNKFIPTTSNLGQNLYRGNNKYAIGVWTTIDLEQKIIRESHNTLLELKMNEIYFSEVKSYISENTFQVVKNSLRKIFDLWILNIDDSRSKNLFLGSISVLTFIFFLIGVIFLYKDKKYQLEYLFLFYSTILAIVFFVLPRYQAMFKIIMIPFLSYGVMVIYNRLIKPKPSND